MEANLYELAKDIFACIGILGVLIAFLNGLFNLIPNLSRLKADLFKYLADSFNFVFLRRAAIKSDIENIVNNVVFQLQAELPKGWIKRASIKWVRDLNRRDQAPEGELILRIRPHSGEEENLVYAVSAFFENIMFPTVNQVIPVRKLRASVLLVSRRALAQKNPSLKDLFNATVLENQIQADQHFIHDFTKFERLDNLGFFTSAYLREMYAIAKESIYTEMRTKIDTELNQVLEHMCQFVKGLGSENGQIKDENLWSRKGPVTSYAFLLVARPDNSGARVYVDRARERKTAGVTRLYLLAREEQKNFAMQVVNEIVRTGEYELEDGFGLHRDYRCNHGGYGAILVTKTN